MYYTFGDIKANSHALTIHQSTRQFLFKSVTTSCLYFLHVFLKDVTSLCKDKNSKIKFEFLIFTKTNFTNSNVNFLCKILQPV